MNGKTKSGTLGKGISEVEVSLVSRQGFRLLVLGREYFLDYEAYPWFREARVRELMDVRLLHGHHLHWPALDVDLEVESLSAPEKYPLTAGT
jgi:hypothetical protein